MSSQKKEKGLSARLLVLLWSLGLIGQIGWNIEGQWFNNFVYEKIGKDPAIITFMLIFSACASTISTFFFGTIADRTGKRRTLINAGYIIWGVLTIAFGFTEFIGKRFYVIACICVVLGDMLVSFFASMSTDAGFGTWTTDIMTDKNRGQIGGIIAVVCVLATIFGGMIGSALVGKDINYTRLFVVIGGFLIAFGIVSIFLMSKKDDVEPSVRGTFKEQFISVFDFSHFFEIKELVFVNIAVTLYFTGFNTYFVYLGNYLIHHIGYSTNMIGIIEGIPLAFATLVAVPISNLINKEHHFHVSITAIVSGIIGMLLIAPVTPDSVDTAVHFDIRIWAGILFLGIGYIISLQTTKAWSKQLHPKGSKGQFEGIWTIFYAMLPMILASITSHIIIKNTGEPFFAEFNAPPEYIPNGNIFIAGVIISSLSVIPFFFAEKYHQKRIGNKK